MPKKRFLSKHKRSIDFLKLAARESGDDITHRAQEFIQSPNAKHGLLLSRSLLNSSTWISRASYMLAKSVAKPLTPNTPPNQSDKEKLILEHVQMGIKLSPDKASPEEILKVIFEEFDYAHKNHHYHSLLEVPKIQTKLVLISGVFNEMFSTLAFERAAKHLNKRGIASYLPLKIKGTASTRKNSKTIFNQLRSHSEKNPDDKYWLVAFSKGGLDALHFMHDYPDIANDKVVGLSTIATPILGNDRLNHKLLKMINSIHRLEHNFLYQVLDQKIDILLKDFQRSLSSEYQESWFCRKKDALPKKPFYNALAFEAEWYESHVWMVLTKLLFRSSEINDGIVDLSKAQFPEDFQATNLGYLKGHHLVGTRSSTFNQEALLESYIVFLKYFDLIN